VTPVVRAIKVDAIPASMVRRELLANGKRMEGIPDMLETYAGKMMVCRIILQLVEWGISTVSDPEQGCAPTKLLSFVEVQQRWQIFPDETLEVSVFEASPAIIRKPCSQ
jgi:hypothetical protein